MRRYFQIIAGFIGFCIVVFGIVSWIFSASGNAFVASLLLKGLESKSGFAWEARGFKLTTSAFNIDFTAHNGALELFVNGKYSLLTQGLEGDFFLNSKGFMLEMPDRILKFPDNVWVEGRFLGKFSDYSLIANSNILQASSDVTAHFVNFTLQDMMFSMKEASLTSVFDVLNAMPYSDGILNIDLTLHRAQGTLFNGKVAVNIDGGNVDTAMVLERLNFPICPTHFLAQLQGEIHKNSLQYDFSLYSSVGDIQSQGITELDSLVTNAQFSLKLQASTTHRIPLYIDANGVIDGKRDVMQIQSLLSLFGEEQGEGRLRLDATLYDFAQGISGEIYARSEDLLLGTFLQSYMKIYFPSIPFVLDSKVQLTQGRGSINYILDSDLATFSGVNGSVSLAPFAFHIPQDIMIAKLQSLAFQGVPLPSGVLQLSGIATEQSLFLDGEIVQYDKNMPLNVKFNKDSFILNIENLSTNEVSAFLPAIPHKANAEFVNLSIKNNASNDLEVFIYNPVSNALLLDSMLQF